MTRFAFPDLTRAFRDGERFGNATMRVGEVAQLVLPTGRIVACDPCYLRSSHARELPYTRAVPPRPVSGTARSVEQSRPGRKSSEL